MRFLQDDPTLRRLVGELSSPTSPCRKQAHLSRGAAEAQIRSIVRRGSDWYVEAGLVSYFCRLCRAWHVGHARKEPK